MFTITSLGTDDTNNKFIRNIVKYPSNIGYTGYALQNKTIIDLTTNNSKNRKEKVEFVEEIDNHVLENDVMSAIYSPIIDGEGKVQGVLQLINIFENSELIGKAYIKELECI